MALERWSKALEDVIYSTLEEDSSGFIDLQSTYHKDPDSRHESELSYLTLPGWLEALVPMGKSW